MSEGRRVDERAEWRSFDDDGKGGGSAKERAGGATNNLLDDGGLATTLALEPSQRHLVRAQAQLRDPNRRLKTGFSAIGEMAGTLQLDADVKDRACELWKNAEMHLRERKLHEACAACIYIACRIERCPRTFKEVTAVARDTNHVLISRCFKTIVNKLGIQHATLNTIKATDFMDRCVSMRRHSLARAFRQKKTRNSKPNAPKPVPSPLFAPLATPAPSLLAFARTRF